MKSTKLMEAKIIKGGGVTSATGFLAAGCVVRDQAARAKKTSRWSSRKLPAEAAATFTTNLVKAAPVKVSMRHLRNGPDARRDHQFRLRQRLHRRRPASPTPRPWSSTWPGRLDSKPREWLICSTGRIGNRLPMPKVRKGIEKAAAKLGHEERRGSGQGDHDHRHPPQGVRHAFQGGPAARS